MSERLLDLNNVADLPIFCSKVIALAVHDDAKGRKSSRTGKQLCNAFCIRWRNGHHKLATAVYNQTRWTLGLNSDD